MEGVVKFLVWAGAILAVMIGVLRVGALRWWQVPTDDPELAAALAPTLAAGDWVILWRMTPPGYGDLVLCPDPHNPAEVVVGRIAGEGRDQLQLKSSDVIVNRKKMATESACPGQEVGDPNLGSPIDLSCSIEALGGVKHMRLNTVRSQETFTTEVQQGRVFLLSDNRHFPFDSRHYGTVDVKSCKETVVFRLVSAQGFGDVDKRLTFIQ